MDCVSALSLSERTILCLRLGSHSARFYQPFSSTLSLLTDPTTSCPLFKRAGRSQRPKLPLPDFPKKDNAHI